MAIFQNFSDYCVGAWIDGGLMIRIEESLGGVVNTFKKSVHSVVAGAVITATLALSGPGIAGAMPSVTIVHGVTDASTGSAPDVKVSVSNPLAVLSDMDVFSSQLDRELAGLDDFSKLTIDAEVFELAQKAVRASASRQGDDSERWADRFFSKT